MEDDRDEWERRREEMRQKRLRLLEEIHKTEMLQKARAAARGANLLRMAIALGLSGTEEYEQHVEEQDNAI